MNPNEIGDSVTDNADEDRTVDWSAGERDAMAEIDAGREADQLRAQLETAEATADALREDNETLRLELYRVYNTLDNLLQPSKTPEPSKTARRSRPVSATDGGALVGIMTSPLTRKLAAQFGKSVIQAMTQGGER